MRAPASGTSHQAGQPAPPATSHQPASQPSRLRRTCGSGSKSPRGYYYPRAGAGTCSGLAGGRGQPGGQPAKLLKPQVLVKGGAGRGPQSPRPLRTQPSRAL
ncbi:hypothetical protein [Crucivirus-501]|nr:hypothetical protein [Crucivirus-501]QMW69001.1 hypothetical protein [Crucivirus-509]